MGDDINKSNTRILEPHTNLMPVIFFYTESHTHTLTHRVKGSLREEGKKCARVKQSGKIITALKENHFYY